MVGKVGLTDRYFGGSGFDWADFKDDKIGVTIDIDGRFFDQPQVPGSGASALARFDIVEGLSGSAFGDVLYGDNEDATTIPTNGATGSSLTNIALIDGLQPLLGAGVTFFNSGNIILGGDGSDRITGRGGNDLIDGDAWLNVRISVRQNLDGTGPEIATFDSMTQMVPDMLSRKYNPGQLQIVREIKYASGPDFDTAVFLGNRADYTITTNNNGTPTNTLDDIVTVTDNVGTDGTDTLKHIERLQFADQAIVLGGLDKQPVGAITVSDTTPAERELLTASIAGVTDADNISVANPEGHITGPVAYFWQERAHRAPVSSRTSPWWPQASLPASRARPSRRATPTLIWRCVSGPSTRMPTAFWRRCSPPRPRRWRTSTTPRQGRRRSTTRPRHRIACLPLPRT